MQNNSIMVFIEQSSQKIAEVSLELICKARQLADQLHTSVTAVAIGMDLKDQLRELGYYGCDQVYYFDDKRVAHFTSVPYAKIMVSMIKKYTPQIVLFGASVNGRDLAPRVSAALKCGLTADCTELEIGGFTFKDKSFENILLQIRPAFGGNIIATIVSPESSPSMASVREGVMKLTSLNKNRIVEIIAEECELKSSDFVTEVIEVVRHAKQVNLKSAKIIVAAGMGVNSATALNLVKELAKTLGAEIGCTRPVVDAGLLSAEYQIGQTGVTVRPNLYIACGISGQIQHVAGVNESRRIVAINTDPKAPIFKVAHYGIIGDLNDVIPKMIKAYKESD